ncbi:PREDICTED: tyrosine-protein kinase receptor Tie-1-like [Branchiostoma belcheri]|uniref:receptor protein-tyrosine kinase n=1 Tax=Branchiostoma belcheri TaxID=7741 RepID=A0A6P5A1E7_BRABE|nr:PREDICTED: tyrosine-protein kinase receptor Tie-1-like [Branchiostoma belcheri]
MALHATVCAVFLLADLLSSFQVHHDLLVLGENVTEIPEDAPVGSTVVRLRDSLVAASRVSSADDANGTFWSANITTGDDWGRFEVRAEDLAMVVAAPLDYRLHSRYNLTVELTNTGNNNVLYVILVIEVIDVSGYPPFYNKQCETPVLSGKERNGDYTLFTSDGFNAYIDGGIVGSYDDYLQYPNIAANFRLKGDCSLKYVIGVERLSGDAAAFAFASQANQGRVELVCHDREWKTKGKLTILDITLDNDLPRWVLSGNYWVQENYRYVFAAELYEMRSTPSYWFVCGANVTFEGGRRLLEWTSRYNVTGCPEGRYGVYCDKNCVCKNGARCHGFNGACECRLGWRGRVCDIPWPEVAIVETPGDSVMKYIGTNLTLTCLAPHILVANMTWAYQTGQKHNGTKTIEEGAVQNSSISFQPILETANGKYSCMVQAEDGQHFNATFILNATECRPNYHGEDCSQVCDCEYGGTCDRWEGCLCPAGRRGDRCERECAPGTFGWNCSMKCNCENKALCDPVNGSCICVEGQWGEFCHECSHGTFGRNCSMKCNCENNALCDPVNGSCICAEGQSGEFCQIVSIPVVAVVLASVIPTIALIGCIVTGVLVKRSRRRQRKSEESTEMTTVTEPLSSWEVNKEDLHLEHMIGEGEFGHVVRARLHVPELGYEVLVAAKSIRPDRKTASAVRDFHREMDILARIHEDKEGHPNVVKLYGVLTQSEPQYILVEYASNEELRRYLWSLREQCKITGDKKLLERLDFACDVACGLTELARLKIVHRDIAARNVVISDRKVAKIADFGLARDVYVSSAYERTEQGGEEELLPLKWMAVESLRDGVYTCESDVWSYGVLLWEIASFGEEPRYAGGPMHPDVCTLLELLRKGVRLQQPQNCPLPVYRIIRSCWVFNPSRRPTAEELCRKIDLMRPQRRAAVNHNIQ